MRRTDSFKNTLMLGKIEAKRRRTWKRMRQLDSITDSMDMNLSKLKCEFAIEIANSEIVMDRDIWVAAVPAIIKSWA